MKSRIYLAIGLALALATPAFAQDSQNTPANQASDQAAPADSQPANSDAQQPAKKVKHHRAKHYASSSSGYSPAAMALTGDDAKTAAYQASNREKAYPAVDHGHVPGDPPIIDHSGDHMAVAPTSTTISVPPATH
jgi:hypothetical protein